MENNILYKIKKGNHNKKDLQQLLSNHPEVKFVSLMGIDLFGNSTDEKIPIKVFLEDIDNFLNGVAVQTDGSSVNLPGISTLDDAKVDMITDLDCDWFIDYNDYLIDLSTSKPIGTLIIPCFLYHNNVPVDSRSILKSSISTFKSTIMELLKKYPKYLAIYNITADDIKDILITSATELEFWVKTPNDKAEIEELTTSQVLHEQYWARINGTVRIALEECLLAMENYELEPEMGHKEVGGIQPKFDINGSHIMEQLEIDWKYSNAIQAADNQFFIKNLINDIFIKHGLETTFMAKPIDNVAGNGMHTHLGVSLKLTNGKIVNIFNGSPEHFLSEIGYGALMGILKNYEIMNPFISSTHDSLRRLKPGYEAPVCIVTSLGKTVSVPSRNRSVLIGLIKDLSNPLATRFELRAPNPCSNTYLVIAVSYLAMLDGINYAICNEKTSDELLNEISKKVDEEYGYLEKGRIYRSEEDVFEYYTSEERDTLFGIAPRTIYENIEILEKNSNKLNILKAGNTFSDAILNSFKTTILTRWATEITQRILNAYRNEIKNYTKTLTPNDELSDEDIKNWDIINNKRKFIYKDTSEHISLFTQICNAFDQNNYKLASNLFLDLQEQMSELRHLYSNYTKNLL